VIQPLLVKTLQLMSHVLVFLCHALDKNIFKSSECIYIYTFFISICLLSQRNIFDICRSKIIFMSTPYAFGHKGNLKVACEHEKRGWKAGEGEMSSFQTIK
jgi:hypothetical protein